MKYRVWGGDLTYQSQEVIAVLVKKGDPKVHISNIKIVWICCVICSSSICVCNMVDVSSAVIVPNGF